MPALASVSDSSAQDDLSTDDMDMDDCDLSQDLTNDIPELEDDVDWSAVRTFQTPTLEDEAAALTDVDPSRPGPRIELIDSGCTCHMSPYKEDFTCLKNIPPKPFRAANKQHFCVTGQGQLEIEVPNDANPSTLLLHEVLYSPEVGYTLVSVGKLDDLGFDVCFHGGTCTISSPDGTQVARVPKDKTIVATI
jgi:hypothetical protein